VDPCGIYLPGLDEVEWLRFLFLALLYTEKYDKTTIFIQRSVRTFRSTSRASRASQTTGPKDLTTKENNRFLFAGVNVIE
jgi:hypothetical protein